ncbi:Hypothetical protein NCS54_00986800 [Fusarium falciforme]|uniref:Hypothetical protein n=1 Tax=Fusarium falciforme TaxID=195108 RepID=UPI002301346E|nr:Hypothetical protein NCS54_00986800 [Fusarium falciforme]WAO92362.1 Hypothetical protein NCS54_00986800 [Fusarium falciforme]
MSDSPPLATIELGSIPSSRAYAPDMDSLQSLRFVRVRDHELRHNQMFLKYHCFSHEGAAELEVKKFIVKEFEEMREFLASLDGEDIHILNATHRTVFLLFGSEFRELCNSLNFAPWVPSRLDSNVRRGLGRRLYGSYYDIWFTVPLINASARIDDSHALSQELLALPMHEAGTTTHFLDDMGMFYLSFNTDTRQTRILYSDTTSNGSIEQKLLATCERAAELGVRDDPFTFLICALSSVLYAQSLYAQLISHPIPQLEDYSNSLKFEIQESEEKNVKETAIRLRKTLPYLEKVFEAVECIGQVIEDTLSEHKECRDLFSIPPQQFLRVEKNLQTLRSQAIAFKSHQVSRIGRVNVSLSTLSSLLSLRTDSAIKASTEAMTRLSEANREDSCKMNDIAMATKLDSEAMITIAKLTMFYLPSTFVATLFSMGIFNFDFDNGKSGRLYMSSQWWLYIIFAMPLTLGTFYWFRAVTRSHKKASEKAEREAKQPE